MSSLENFLRDKLTGDDIREIRTIMGVSQDRFSKIVGVVGQTVWLWESGRQEIGEENQSKILAIINDLLRDDTKDLQK